MTVADESGAGSTKEGDASAVVASGARNGFSLSLLGPCHLRVAGRELSAPREIGTKELWLLALLVLKGGGEGESCGPVVPRAALASALWPESPNPGRALYNLRRCLSDLRRSLGPEAWRLGEPGPAGGPVRLDLSAPAEVDVPRFDAALRRGDPRSLSEAVSLYRGPLLEGCPEPWALPHRAARREAYLCALERLARLATERGDHRAAAAWLRRALAESPLREGALRALLTALAAAGEPAAALEVYREFRERLREADSGASLTAGPPAPAPPSRETLAVYERLRIGMAAGGVAGGAPAARDPAAAVRPAGGAVPVGAPYYVERSTDSEFFRAVARGDSVVLLKGPRQVGKTSLLARGLDRARGAGCRVVTADLQKLGPAQVESADALLRALARHLARELGRL